ISLSRLTVNNIVHILLEQLEQIYGGADAVMPPDADMDLRCCVAWRSGAGERPEVHADHKNNPGEDNIRSVTKVADDCCPCGNGHGHRGDRQPIRAQRRTVRRPQFDPGARSTTNQTFVTAPRTA